MKLIFLFSILILSFNISYADSSCTTITKCNSGTALCSAASTFESIGECGILVGQSFSCRTQLDNGDTHEQTKTFICCKQSGSAYVTNSETNASKECATPGVIQ